MQQRRDGLVADLVEPRLLEVSACQRERLAMESAEEREASLHPAAYSWVWCNINMLTVAQARLTMLCIPLVYKCMEVIYPG